MNLKSFLAEGTGEVWILVIDTNHKMKIGEAVKATKVFSTEYKLVSYVLNQLSDELKSAEIDASNIKRVKQLNDLINHSDEISHFTFYAEKTRIL